ncbi:MAG: glycoside hydrolase family 15 protein [Dehalococcoidia bacterium]|nr:glycoside hydrolase family 15 protein [Dehalococcoidia bacterium]
MNTRGVDRGYRPIGDYALIGDTHSAALVARDGSIDWLCWPQFDSPAVFGRLLDAARGGSFRVGPAGPAEVARSYAGDTNILVTTFTTGTGRLRLTDFMPVGDRPSRDPNADIARHGRVLRLIEGLTGEVELQVSFRPAFDYARAPTETTTQSRGATARAGRESLILSCPVTLSPDPEGGVSGTARVGAGERLWFVLTYAPGGEPTGPAAGDADADAALAQTLEYWQAWSAACTYSGPYHDLVRRSALTLKLLTFSPTGALVASPTTSLPEEVGGARNWDYRYSWLRDASLTLSALQEVGYHREAAAFFGWLEGICLRSGHKMQIMYRIDGRPDLPEQTLNHLEGYRRSRPVRIGNAAAEQTQLDIYGEVLDAAWTHVEHLGPPSADVWGVLWRLADQAAARWQEPGAGIWEVRGGPRHYLYSKLLCWVALDRAVWLAKHKGLEDGRLARWRRTRGEIRRAILTQGYDREAGAFTQVLDEPALDASALVVPLVGFLPATDPRVRSTVERIQERLTAHGLVYRYLSDDGLPRGEATFTLCSFWLVDNLALAGRVDEARALFERITAYANDVGLLAEEIDPATGELLGNYPQGFSHLALIRSALTIARAEARAGPPASSAGLQSSRGRPTTYEEV